MKECFTWNDFGRELQTIPDATDTTKWRREYSDVLSNGTQEVEFQIGYIAKYVLFIFIYIFIRGMGIMF